MESPLYDTPIPPVAQEIIARALWGFETKLSVYRPFNTTPYFHYYSEQCLAVYHAFGGRIPIRTHQDVADIVQGLLTGLPRQAIRAELAAKYSSLVDKESNLVEVLDGSIDLAIRLLLMLDVGQFPRTHTGRAPLQWTEGSLAEFLGEVFTPQRTLSNNGVKLDSQFTARNLDLIAGLEVELTTNLADHLVLREEDKKILIFHHASFLKNQHGTLFPEGLVNETLRTLAILFPQGNKETKRWYRKQDEAEDRDDGVLHCGSVSRNIEDYSYWYDRLVILKERFDEPHRSSLSQLWNDRRQGIQWYTLWVAIGFTVFFGLVQSIEGLLQVYKAFKPS